MKQNKWIRLLLTSGLLLAWVTLCNGQKSFIKSFDHNERDDYSINMFLIDDHLFTLSGGFCGNKQCSFWRKLDLSGNLVDSLIVSDINPVLSRAQRQIEDQIYWMGNFNDTDSIGFVITITDANLNSETIFHSVSDVDDIIFEQIEITDDYVIIPAVELCKDSDLRVPTIHVFDRNNLQFIERIEINSKVLVSGLYYIEQLQDGEILVIESTGYDNCEYSDEVRALRYTKFSYPDFNVSVDTIKHCRLVTVPHFDLLPNGQLMVTSLHENAEEEFYTLVHIMNQNIQDLGQLSSELEGAASMSPVAVRSEDHYFLEGWKSEYENETDYQIEIAWLQKMNLDHQVLFERHYKIPNYNMSFVDIIEGPDMNYIYGLFRDEGPVGGQRDLVLLGLTKEMCYDTDCSDVIILDQLVNALDKPTAEIAGAVYPNPVTDVLYISGTEIFDRYELVSLSGQVIATGSLVSNQIKVSDLKSGIYFIKISQSDKTFSRRFVKM